MSLTVPNSYEGKSCDEKLLDVHNKRKYVTEKTSLKIVPVVADPA